MFVSLCLDIEVKTYQEKKPLDTLTNNLGLIGKLLRRQMEEDYLCEVEGFVTLSLEAQMRVGGRRLKE